MKVLSLNCWGLLLVSKKRGERVTALGAALSAGDWDVVCLQEVWVSSDARSLAACASKAGLVHSVHFKHGLFGAGLVTLSRFSIEEFGFHQYAAAGDPAALHCGDYLSKKGVGWVRLLLPSREAVDVFNTHLHANYSHKVKAKCGPWKLPEDGYAPYRLSQVLELAQVIRHTSKQGVVGSVLCGDLNTKPDYLEYGLLRLLLPSFVDSWHQLHGGSLDEGHTCRAPGNTFQSTRQVPERIDYVLTNLTPISCEVCMKVSPLGFSYSDHHAVQAQLLLQPLAVMSTNTPHHPSVPPCGATCAGVGMICSCVHSECLLPEQQQFGTQGLGGSASMKSRQEAQLNPQLPGPEPLKPQQVLGNYSTSEAVLQSAKRILVSGVRSNRRHAKQRILLGLFCAVCSLVLHARTAFAPHAACAQLYHLPPLALLCQLWTLLVAPALAFLAALALLMGVADIGQSQALQQAGTERVTVLIARLDAALNCLYQPT